MGKTLLGIDLDESPVGGYIERLLSEEDLEKLTDGGREPRDESDASDTSDAAADGGDAATDDRDAGTDLVDDAVDDGSETTVPVGTSGDDPSDAWDTPNPDGPATLRDPVPSPGDADADDGGWKEKLRSVLPKVAVALVVLAVVAVLAYRYLGKAKRVASDKLGSDDESDQPEPRPTEVTGDVPEARRRAKAPSRDEREEFADQPVDETVDRARRAESDERDDREDDEAGPDSVGRPRTDSDVGALVGLAALAVVAAAVRKFSEEPERDPLVDGPRDDADE
ncbi:hypothetical protein [Halosimplex salinum]|uniref:hypothetical protein n=1 Tax=Halosimplex salinum TaxID=1710538 RepID=UPI000F4AEFD7|nr:hypothetical protein [Halosimplex salinum]